jgi:acyl-CoA thioester hydrolase
MMAFSHRLRVRYGECDPQGVVFNANYLAYVDVAFTAMWRQLVGSYDTLIARGVDLMLVQSNLTFRRPARSEDEIDVELSVASLGRTSMALDVAIRALDAQTLVEGSAHYVFVDARQLTKQPVPDDLRALLERPQG